MANYSAGKREGGSIEPPKAVDVLARVFEGKGSDLIPRKHFEAAHWWIAHQEQPDEWRERMEPITVNGDTRGWKTPYIDRLVNTARIFLALKHPHQVFVIEKVKAGIPWRGDSPAMFVKICEQAEIMRIDPAAYRERAASLLRSALKTTGRQA